MTSIFDYNNSKKHQSRYCQIEGCRSTIEGEFKTNSSVSFSGDDQLKNQWIQQIQKNNGQTVKSFKSFRICDRHFQKSDLINVRGDGVRRRQGSVPVFFPKTHPTHFGCETTS